MIVIRYVLSRINKDGLRVMVYAQQGRHTYATRDEAQKHLDDFLKNNTQERLIEVFGEQAVGTFEVSAIECYSGHFDPVGCYISKRLNPDPKSPCDVDVLFPKAEKRIREVAKFTVINRGGPHGMDTKSECWEVVEDPLKVQGCVMCLIKFLDGSPMAVRYKISDVFIKILVPYKDKDRPQLMEALILLRQFVAAIIIDGTPSKELMNKADQFLT